MEDSSDSQDEFVDALVLRKVEQAMSMTREERFRAGGELFELACEVARAGIRTSLATNDFETVEEQLRERLQLQDLLDGTAPQ